MSSFDSEIASNAPTNTCAALARSAGFTGTQPGREFVLRQRGVPRLKGRGRGDLRVRVRVTVPTKLTDFETELLKKLADSRGEEVQTEHGLLSRFKSAFQ